MSCKSDYRKMRSTPLSASAALDREFYEMREEGALIVQEIAKREPAKVVAFKARIKPRHTYNLREDPIAQPDLGWPHFMMLAKRDSKLRLKCLEWLEAHQGENGQDPARLASEFAQFLMQRDRRT